MHYESMLNLKKLTNIRNDITIRLKHKHPLKFFDIVILRFGRPFSVVMDVNTDGDTFRYHL